MRKFFFLGLLCALIGGLGIASFLFSRGWIPEGLPREMGPRETTVSATWRNSHVAFADTAYLEVAVVASADLAVPDTITIHSPMQTIDFVIEGEKQKIVRSGNQIIAIRTFSFRCLTCLARQDGYSFSRGAITLQRINAKSASTIRYDLPKLFITSRLVPQNLAEPIFEPDRLEAPEFSQPHWLNTLVVFLPWMFVAATVGAIVWTALFVLRKEPSSAAQKITLRLCCSKLRSIAKAVPRASTREEIQRLCDSAWYWFAEALNLIGTSEVQETILKRLDAFAFGEPQDLPVDQFRTVAHEEIVGALLSVRKLRFGRIRRWIGW